jgi:ribosomal protein S18 acetylase RimI-like enzyme
VTGPTHPLDNPAWSALTGPQRGQAEVAGRVARYRPGISLFAAFDGPPGPDHWAAMADLAGPSELVITAVCTGTPPVGWSVEFDGDAAQMTGAGIDGVAGPGPDGVVRLGVDDVDDMMDLVAETRPGPFTQRTWELGGYLGVRRGGRLVAMAGERMRPVGWAEISAVATRHEHRGQGLGRMLVGAVASGIVARGETPVLHVSTDNTGAIRLYESMGFDRRGTVRFVAARAPA